MFAKEPSACEVVLCGHLKPTIYIHRMPAVTFSFLSRTICYSLCTGWNGQVGTRTGQEVLPKNCSGKERSNNLSKAQVATGKGHCYLSVLLGKQFSVGWSHLKCVQESPGPELSVWVRFKLFFMCHVWRLIEILWISIFREYKMTCLSFPSEVHSLHSYIKIKF